MRKYGGSKNRLTAAMAALLAVSVALAGCGKQENTKTGSGEAERTLKLLSQYDSFDPNSPEAPEGEPGRILEEITEQKVEYYMLPAENINEKLYIEISGNADYDIIKLRKEQYDTLVTQGALLDLRPYLEKYAPNIMMEGVISEDIWKTVQGDNGEIYGIPEKNSYNHINNCIAYRKDILAEYGIEPPATTDEFLEAVKKLAAEGIKSPLVSTLPIMSGISGAFGVVNDWNEVDGALLYKGMDPGFLQYADYVKELYQCGAMGKDPFGTMKSNDTFARFAGGDAAFFIGAWWNAPELVKDMTSLGVENASEQIGWIQSLVGPDGKKGVFRDKGVSYVTAVPKYMESSAQQVCEYLNKKFDEAVVTEYVLGEKDVQYVIEDGNYRPGPEYRTQARPDWYLSGIPEKLWEEYWPASIYNKTDQYNAWSEIQSRNEEFGVYDVLKLAPPLKLWGNSKEVLNTMVDDQLKMYVGGTIPDLSELTDKLKAEGMDEITAEVNGWYEKFSK